jgi:hypothetical protein
MTSAADLGDARRDRRFADVLATLARAPELSIPQACGGWGATKATYRFLSNPHMDTEELRASLVEATVQACAGRSRIYAVQDTTYFNFSTLCETTGLGPIGATSSKDLCGLITHSTLALDAHGTPLGLLDQFTYARDPEKKPARALKRAPIEQKESGRWLNAVRAVRECFARLPAPSRPEVVHVMDREGDIHELFDAFAMHGDRFIVRCNQNRRVAGPGYAHDAVAAAPLLGRGTVRVPRRQGARQARTATLEYRATRVELDPSCPSHPNRRRLPLTLVEVREVEAPEGVKALRWRLWTSEAVETLVQVKAVAAAYALRWRIEDVHLTLKSGCKVEDLQLETAERLQRALVLYSAVAVRVVALRDLSRQQPDAPCTVLLDEDEWRVLWLKIHRRTPTAKTPTPTLREAVLWIGRLGGHLNRRRDGPPGVRTLWRGLQTLEIMLVGYRAARQLL